MFLRAATASIPLDRPVVMGILNVTPDSFSDGGLWLESSAAIEHAGEMVEQGAAIVDVGGESTRPGAEPVSEDEELRRVLPVIEAIAAETDAAISIDTRKVSVARRALEAGATIVNDTAGEGADHAMDELAAETGAGIVVMHSRGTPLTMRSLTDYSDVVTDVGSFLERRADRLIDSGVKREAIAIDPGFGFAKTPAQNLTLLNRLTEIVALGYPVLAGTSRKSFIGAVLDLPEDQRVEGTIATSVIAFVNGARILRVHDVSVIVRALRVAEAVVTESLEA